MLEQRLVGPRRLDGLAPPANRLQPGCRQVDHGIPAAERNPVLTAPAGGARLTCVAFPEPPVVGVINSTEEIGGASCPLLLTGADGSKWRSPWRPRTTSAST